MPQATVDSAPSPGRRRRRGNTWGRRTADSVTSPPMGRCRRMGRGHLPGPSGVQKITRDALEVAPHLLARARRIAPGDRRHHVPVLLHVPSDPASLVAGHALDEAKKMLLLQV